MDDGIDKRVITDDFLLKYFPSKNGFHETDIGKLESSTRIYLEFKKNLNQERTRSGQPSWSDSDIKQIIEREKGTVELPRPW